MHQSVTHRARLKDVGETVEDFLAALAPLGQRLGVVLVQLPPDFKSDKDRLMSFLKGLPKGFRYAMEFRHPSWNDPAIYDLLRASGVALCAAEAEIGESSFVKTASFGYLRLRKVPPYTDAEIGTAQKEVGEILHQVEDLYMYVKHDDEGAAPEAVLRLQSLMPL
jgi:uncharacterized protein YecE (DUF72 family)